VAHNDAVTTTETTIGTGSVFADNGSGADTDPDTALSVAAVNGDFTKVGQQITLASGALLTVNADGTYSYDPNGKFNGLAYYGSGAANSSAPDGFTYTLTGGSTATVSVPIHGLTSPG